MGWDRQINMKGDTLADWAAESLDQIAESMARIVMILEKQYNLKYQYGEYVMVSTKTSEEST